MSSDNDVYDISTVPRYAEFSELQYANDNTLGDRFFVRLFPIFIFIFNITAVQQYF